MRRFPQELIDLVLDLFHDDIPTLRACSLICNAWVPTTRLHLFDAVTLQCTSHGSGVSIWDFFDVLGSDSPSMSRRRRATNRPILNCQVSMPPPLFKDIAPPIAALSSLTSSGSVTPSAINAVPSPSFFVSPSTPHCQMIQKKRSPPKAPRQLRSKVKRYPSLRSDHLFVGTLAITSRLTPRYPFTPLEASSTQELPRSLSDPVSDLVALVPRQCHLDESAISPSTLPSRLQSEELQLSASSLRRVALCPTSR